MKTKSVKAIAAFFVFALTGAAVADTWKDTSTGITWTYEVDDGEAYIGDDYRCAVDPRPSGVVEIPASILGYPVAAIGDYAFEGCDEITKVIVPNGVRSIGNYAFSTADNDSYPYCTSLRSVTIPGSVESIGEGAFYGCTAMADGNGFVIVNDVLYQYAGSAASVTVPAGVKEISANAFDDCDFITSLTLPNGLVRIGTEAFAACFGLTGLTLPASVREIGGGAFSSCSSLSMTIPDTVVEIGEGAFYGCRAMADANGFVIVRSALHYYDVLKPGVDVYIPSGVTLVCSRAFGRNAYIRSVTIPYGVQSIGSRAFYDCSILTDVEIPESVVKIGRDAFKNSALNKVYVVPDDTDRVRDLIAKSGFANAASIVFEEDVPPSEEYRTETVDGIKWTYHIIAGGAEIYNHDYTAIDDTTAGAITVPSTLGGFPVVSIGDYAFQDCDALTAVTIPAGVRNIGSEAFWGCTALSSVALPVGLQTIDDWAFDECSSLSDISIPDSVDYIGDCAFYGCASMADAGGFVIVRGVLHYYAGSAANVTVPAGVKVIGSSAFDYNENLRSVTIPYGVTEIGGFAFDGCENLASVEIPGSVEDIGSGAFRGCSAMAGANGFVVVRNVLYHYAGSAANVEVPYGVESISAGAFRKNNAITGVSVPYGVKSIGNSVFVRCENLSSISIQSSVAKIGKNAFMDTALATVHVVPGDVDRVRTMITGSGYDGLLSFYDDLPANPPPANDMFADATAISGASGSVAGINENATLETDEPLPKFGNCQHSVWWTWTAPNSGTATFDTIGSSFDTMLGVYTGNAVASLATMAENDDINTEVRQSRVSFDAVKDTTYRIAVAGYQANVGDITLNWSLASASTKVLVTFNANGGKADSPFRPVEIGAEIGPLPDATLSGYTLVGWFTDRIDGVQVDEHYVVNAAQTLYAHWKEGSLPPPGYETEEVGGVKWTYRVVDGEAEIYNDDNAAIPNSTAGAITVPSTLGGYPVTRIGDWAFDVCEYLTSVTVPSGVRSLGQGAFSECYGLERVSLPEGLTTIEDGAFQFCESLETISIPSTVTGIGDGVFQDCYALADDDGFVVVSGILFDYFGTGGDITIPSSAKTIWDYAMYKTASLTGVTIPGSAKVVGYEAFGHSANLRSVTFGRGVTTIGEIAFYECAALVEARIPSSVTSIGEDAFGGTSLNKVYVGYGDTARVKGLLKASGFDTAGVKFLEDAEPSYCTVTLELNGGSGVATTLEVDPGERIGLLPIPDGPDGRGFAGWFWDSAFTDEVEPTDEVLGDCTCYAKWSARIGTETTFVDGVPWTYFVDGKKATLYNNGRPVVPSDYEGALVIPSKIAGNTVVGISERAFYGCTGLTSVIIPDSVAAISDKAFSWCESLEVVQFGKGMSKGNVYVQAFKGCEWLRVLDFKGTTPVAAIKDAFDGAGAMTPEGKPSVYVTPSAAKKWGSEWMGMKVNPYSYYANIAMSVRPGKEWYGGITPVASGKATEIGKKVALKAKANSGYVFAGWYDLDTGLRVSRSASYAYLVTGEDKRFEADFVDFGTDFNSLDINVYDVWTEDDGSAFIDIGAAVSSCSEPKITVKGLPSGLKYDSKTQKITGQSKKPGVYKVTVSASNASQKKAQTAEFELVVPNWTCAAMPNLEPDPDDYGTIWCGVAFNNELVNCTPAPGWSVKASGLPTGLKWTDKVVVDKKTGVIIAKANTIYGVPTKPGNYTVTFTATSGKAKQSATITLKVVARPDWAVGTFNGGSDIAGAMFGDPGAGQATLTIAANGKISGKFLAGGKTWTISAANFDYGNHGEYVATVTAKSGSDVRTEEILLEMYGLDVVGGMVTADGGLGALTLYQTNWKAEPWKSLAKNAAFADAAKRELPYDRSDTGEGRIAYLSLKFATSGAVTVKGAFNIGGVAYNGSASATLVPLTEPDTTSNGAFTGEVCAYLPAKDGKFGGYFERLKVKWTGMAFLLVD